MKFAIRSLLFGVALALAYAGSAPAHHSMSMYDLDHAITLRGTVTDFAWSNPHAQVQFDVTDDKGVQEKWRAECPSPGRLSRAGWSMETLRIGDQVVITGNQAKDGSNLMRLDRVVLPDGRELTGYSH